MEMDWSISLCWLKRGTKMEWTEVRFAWRWQPSSNEVINIYFFSFLLDNMALTRMVLIHEVINCVGCYFSKLLQAFHCDMASAEVAFSHSRTTIHWETATILDSLQQYYFRQWPLCEMYWIHIVFLKSVLLPSVNILRFTGLLCYFQFGS